MEIKEVRVRKSIPGKKNQKSYFYFQQFLAELQKRELPGDIVTSVNESVEEINGIPSTAKNLGREIKQHQRRIVKLIEKELKIVPRNYYQNTWLVYGMAFFGLPIGFFFTAMLGNFGLLTFGLGTGMAMGLAIGFSVGKRLDKKAFEEGRQLDAELRL